MLSEEIRNVYNEYSSIFGVNKITVLFAENCIHVGEKLIQTLMQDMNLK